MAGVLASAAFQVVYLLRQWGTASRHDNVHMLLVVAYHFLILSTMLGREPTLYRRYRVWIYAVMRPLGYLSPSVRSTKAAASVLLSISATPGAWGAVMDLKRVMLGALWSCWVCCGHRSPPAKPSCVCAALSCCVCAPVLLPCCSCCSCCLPVPTCWLAARTDPASDLLLHPCLHHEPYPGSPWA